MRFCIFCILYCLGFSLNSQGVLIGNGTAPASSAVLEISSQQKGVLIPRLTTFERNLIQSPDTGLAIFNLDNLRFECFSGFQWQPCNPFPVLGPGLALSNDTLKLSGHFIGELFGGGIVFHLFKDPNGVEHGLILALQNQGWLPWGLHQTDVQNAESSWNGFSNSQAILATPGSQNSVAAICDNYSGGGFTDWYLPSVNELGLVWNNLYTINRVLQQVQGSHLIGETWYWSSTEVNSTIAWAFSFYYGYAYNQGYLKTDSRMVRSVRSF